MRSEIRELPRIPAWWPASELQRFRDGPAGSRRQWV